MSYDQSQSEDNEKVRRILSSTRRHPAELISVAIRPGVHVVGGGKISARDLSLLKKWVDVNKNVLVRYWHGDIEYTEDAIAP